LTLFRFTAKIPKSVTHDKMLGKEIESDTAYFYKSFEPLKSKTLDIIKVIHEMTFKDHQRKIGDE
jgi:uncharacterized protein YecE (DUF72 family)